MQQNVTFILISFQHYYNPLADFQKAYHNYRILIIPICFKTEIIQVDDYKLLLITTDKNRGLVSMFLN